MFDLNTPLRIVQAGLAIVALGLHSYGKSSEITIPACALR